MFSEYIFCCFVGHSEATVFQDILPFFKEKFVVLLHSVIRYASVIRSVNAVKVLIVNAKKSVTLL